jgi:hypothetical protein
MVEKATAPAKGKGIFFQSLTKSGLKFCKSVMHNSLLSFSTIAGVIQGALLIVSADFNQMLMKKCLLVLTFEMKNSLLYQPVVDLPSVR